MLHTYSAEMLLPFRTIFLVALLLIRDFGYAQVCSLEVLILSTSVLTHDHA